MNGWIVVLLIAVVVLVGLLNLLIGAYLRQRRTDEAQIARLRRMRDR